LKKILKYLFIGIILFFIISVLYVKYGLPNVGDAPEMKIELTAERIERGRYLANHVTVCIDCHSARDWMRYSGPPIEGTLGKGGDVFDQKFGFPGFYTSKNITPAGLSGWTDGEIYRAITAGVNKDGKALFPVMPYPYYGQMDEEDIKCIIAYIRTLKPIENTPAESKSDFPFSLIINTLPKKGVPQPRPDVKDIIATGKYLINAANCVECHSQIDDKGQLIAGKEFGGGREFPLPEGTTLRSSNITSDDNAGIGGMTKDQFINMFRTRSDSTLINSMLNPGDLNTIMPWGMYGGMTDQDLGAIYAYLKTVKPIKEKVLKYSISN
jgi:mono/diheme cytochrome c family protein